MTEEKPVEEQYDDPALFDVACYLLEKTGQTQDPRIAAVCEACIDICKQDTMIIAKLFAELQKYQKQSNQQPFNPFMPPTPRNVPRTQ